MREGAGEEERLAPGKVAIQSRELWSCSPGAWAQLAGRQSSKASPQGASQSPGGPGGGASRGPEVQEKAPLAFSPETPRWWRGSPGKQAFASASLSATSKVFPAAPRPVFSWQPLQVAGALRQRCQSCTRHCQTHEKGALVGRSGGQGGTRCRPAALMRVPGSLLDTNVSKASTGESCLGA